MPLKIFVLLAGAAYTPWRVAAPGARARQAARHRAGVAAAYREQALAAFERYSAALALAVLAVVTAVRPRLRLAPPEDDRMTRPSGAAVRVVANAPPAMSRRRSWGP
ncbi:MAG: hypothetical protein R2708_23550 [Vicinamibacterales bacterium]